jgi:hypothetical protein
LRLFFLHILKRRSSAEGSSSCTGSTIAYGGYKVFAEFDFTAYLLTKCPPYPVPNDWGDHAQDGLPAHHRVAAGSVGRPGGTGPGGQGDFSSQAEAQAYFEANGGSPSNNVDNLDADHDGQACEAFDYGGGGGGTGGSGTGGGDTASLANTGPQNKTLLPAGVALLVAGLAMVGMTRYRARHARR